jgi:hypothetical protein
MSETVIIACIVALPPTVAALAALVVSLKGNRKVDNLVVQVDGRLTQLLASVKTENQATGHAAGVEAERTRVEGP